MTVNNKDYAVVVGIDHYPDYRPLSGPINDAMEFNTWLLDTDKGGGLPSGNVKLILSEKVDAGETPKPFQDMIDRAISSIKRSVQQTGGRRFYFYFSGHGLGTSPDQAALCLSGWSLEFNTLALLSRAYQNNIINLGLFDEVVFLLDCCRVRIASAGGLPPSNPAIRPVQRSTRYYVGFATEYQNEAFEAAVSGNQDLDESGPIVRGNFTRALMAGLWGGAAGDAGGVSAYDLKQYLEEQTKSIAATNNQNQKAVVLTDFPMPPGTKIVFGNARPEYNVQINFSAARRGKITLVDKDMEVVKEDDASSGPWQLHLNKGIHVLTEAATGEEITIPFRPEKEVFDVNF